MNPNFNCKNNRKPNLKTQHRQRCELIFLLYQYYVMEEDNLKKIWKDFINNTDIFTIRFIKNYCAIFNQVARLQRLVEPFLKKTWKFQRVNNLYKAILVVGAYEINVLKQKKAIVIHEANEIADLYSIQKDFKFIHATLDKIS